jgi:hypothetical protein
MINWNNTLPYPRDKEYINDLKTRRKFCIKRKVPLIREKFRKDEVIAHGMTSKELLSLCTSDFPDSEL